MSEKSEILSGRQAAGYVRMIFGLPEPEEIGVGSGRLSPEVSSVIRGSLTTESYEAAEVIQMAELTRQIEKQVAGLAAEKQVAKPGKNIKI